MEKRMQTHPAPLRLSCIVLAMMAQLACHKSTTSAPAGNGTPNDNDTSPWSGTGAQSTLGAAGGTLASPSQDASLSVPGLALTGNTTLTVASVDPKTVASAGLTLASRVFAFGPSGTQFTVPATLTINVSNGVTASSVALATL